MKIRLALLCALVSAPSLAQVPRPLDLDPRIETLEWRSGVELPLRTTTGGNVTLIFGPGEAVQSVSVGDPAAIMVDVAPQADSLVVRTLRRPASGAISVRTQLREYRFNVIAGPANDVAYVVRFGTAVAGSAPQPAMILPQGAAAEHYRIKGETGLRPKRISDDGAKTYIEWGDDQALPAVFALNALGEEETVDSYMRQGVMVIDRIYPKLIFRIGKRTAEASVAAPDRRKRG